MFRRQSIAALLILALVAACAAPAASPSPAVSGTPTASLPSPTASPSPSPTAAPTPSATPSPTLTPATPSPTIAPTPTPTPTTTMIVRAYFLLGDGSGGEVVNEPTLVPVLRTVPESPATATAAVRALLAGPSAKERAAMPQIATLIPAGSRLLGIEISGGLATVDLSAEFASLSPLDAGDGGVFSLRGRLAQVVYTLTQFTTVDRVNFKLEGKPVTVFASEEIVLDKPVTRATYRDRYLPLIFVDRPAWGAALLNPGRVTGLANVFEAQFRIALLDRNDKVLVDVPVLATCGTGCWGGFDVTLSYDVSSAQWGTLRVWDISEYSGKPVAVREYPVYLRSTP
jgi:sporulation and spore germination protein/immunoglobulin-like protein involved in spore germination